MENKDIVFVLIGKERFFDTVPHVMSATGSQGINKIHEISERMSEDYIDLDLMLYTYIDGDLVEIATYDRDENEFNLLSRFENE